MTQTKTRPSAQKLLQSYTDWYAEGLRQYADTWDNLMAKRPALPTFKRAKDCGCGTDCGCDPCSCCTPDADIVVRARLGERRIIPVVVVNEWRRERPVTISLGPWKGCPGDPTVQVHGLVLPEGELTLGPCERRQLIVEVTAVPGDAKTAVAALAAKEEKATARRPRATEREQLPTAVRDRHLDDLDACATYCAELSIEGCSHRPVRFALQVLPRTCDPYEIECSCGCC